ncbi:MAG: NAD(P)H-binding protein, partial [Marmoricola sp.]
MRIVIAGGHGQIARQFGKLVSAAGHQPVGMIRKPEHIPDLEDDGVEPALIDLEHTDVEAMTEIVRGADAVVFAAGGGPDGNAARKETVDKGAAIMLADAAEAAGVRRYLMVSAMGTEGADP